MPSFTTSDSSCPIIDYKLSTNADTIVAPTDLDYPMVIDSATNKYVIRPLDISMNNKVYEFYVHVTADGGSVLKTSKQTLVVGCPGSVYTIADNAGLITSATIAPGADPSTYTFLPPTITPSG